jgi:N,N'-diacetyllegionaminate synthase
MIIAEVASAHRGDSDKLIQIIKSFQEIKEIDFFKFQIYDSKDLGQEDTDTFKTFQALEFDIKTWKKCLSHSKKDYIVEVFDEKHIQICEENLNCAGYKIHTTNIDELSFITKASKTGKQIFLSTSGLSDEEIKQRVNIILKNTNRKDLFLVTGHQSYPTNYENLNIGKVRYLKEKFDLPVIFADHSSSETNWSIESPILAIGAGALGIEKHIILSRPSKDNDYFSSLEPSEFKIFAKKVNQSKVAASLNLEDAVKDELNYKNSVVRRKVGKDYVRSKNLGLPTMLESNSSKFKSTGVLFIARTDSERLTEKVILPIDENNCILDIILEKSKCILNASKKVLCTTDNQKDEILIAFANKHKINTFKGAKEDVLKRMIDCAESYNLENVVRVTCDNPLYDPKIIDDLISIHVNNNNDFTTLNREMIPVGVNVEIYKLDYLLYLHSAANNKEKTEYLTFLVEDDLHSKFKKQTFDLKFKNDLSHEVKNARMTVDYYEDVAFLRKINTLCNIINSDIESILYVLKKNPDVLKINNLKHIINPYDIKSKINLKILR